MPSTLEVWGHRGESIRHPENTLRAFRAAMDSGADGIELDIQKTADGHFMVIHDQMLERTTDGIGPIGSKSLRELRSLDAGEGEKIPELHEVLELLAEYRNATIDIELKKETIRVDDFEAIQEILKPYEGRIRWLITSFEHSLLKSFSKAGYPTGLLIRKEHEAGGIIGIFKAIRQIRPTHLNLPYKIFERVPPMTLRLTFFWMRISGIKLVFWTVNKPEEYRKIRRVASAIISVDPGLMVKLAGRR